jgi:hypothetical protein
MATAGMARRFFPDVKEGYDADSSVLLEVTKQDNQKARVEQLCATGSSIEFAIEQFRGNRTDRRVAYESRAVTHHRVTGVACGSRIRLER